jgi:hypothetical protein
VNVCWATFRRILIGAACYSLTECAVRLESVLSNMVLDSQSVQARYGQCATRCDSGWLSQRRHMVNRHADTLSLPLQLPSDQQQRRVPQCVSIPHLDIWPHEEVHRLFFVFRHDGDVLLR